MTLSSIRIAIGIMTSNSVGLHSATLIEPKLQTELSESELLRAISVHKLEL